MNYRFALWIAFTCVFVKINLSAQNNSNASGGNATGSGGAVSYSIGETVYTSNSSSVGVVEQGVQHAYEFLTVGTSTNELDVKMSVFPNPANDIISLSITDFKNQTFSFQLMDALGQIILSKNITENVTSIDASALPTASYLLNIVDSNNTIIRSIKIIKS